MKSFRSYLPLWLLAFGLISASAMPAAAAITFDPAAALAWVGKTVRKAVPAKSVTEAEFGPSAEAVTVYSISKADVWDPLTDAPALAATAATAANQTTANSSLTSILTQLGNTASPVPIGNAQVTSSTATITSGQSLSAAVDLGTTRMTALVIPSAWTTASITFQTSYDCSTYADVYDEFGNEKTVTVGGVSRRILLTPADWIGVRCVKVRSGTTGAAVTQGADRAVILVTVR